MVRLTVATCDTSAIETEFNVKILDADVMYKLIETTLQEGRVDGSDRLQPFAGKSGSKCYAVLFGNPNVKGSIRELLKRGTNACTIGHRRS